MLFCLRDQDIDVRWNGEYTVPYIETLALYGQLSHDKYAFAFYSFILLSAHIFECLRLRLWMIHNHVFSLYISRKYDCEKCMRNHIRETRYIQSKTLLFHWLNCYGALRFFVLFELTRCIVQDILQIQQFIVFIPRSKHLLFIFFTFASCGSLFADTIVLDICSIQPFSSNFCARHLVFHFSQHKS